MTRREHQYGYRAPTTDVTAHFQARHVGEAEVEHDQIHSLRRGEVEPLARGAGVPDAKANLF